MRRYIFRNALGQTIDLPGDTEHWARKGLPKYHVVKSDGSLDDADPRNRWEMVHSYPFEWQ